MDTFTQGTKEYYIVDLTDELGVITDLTGSTPQYDLRGPSGSYVTTDNSASINPDQLMELFCMIDTTLHGNIDSPDGSVHTWLPGGEYRLYVTVTVGSEVPRFGPFGFTIDDS